MFKAMAWGFITSLLIIELSIPAFGQSNRIVFGPLEGDNAGILTVRQGEDIEIEMWVRTDPDENPTPIVGVKHFLMSTDVIIAEHAGVMIDPDYDTPNWDLVFVETYVHDPLDDFPIPPGYTCSFQCGLYDVGGLPQGDPLDTQGEWDYYGSFLMTCRSDIPPGPAYWPFTEGWHPIYAHGTHWDYDIPPGGAIIPEQDYCGVFVDPNSCQLSNCGETTMYWPYWDEGDRVVTYLDPADCLGDPAYPFEIASLDFQLYIYDGDYPMWMDIVVYDMLDPGDFCQGPGVELYRFAYPCDESFQFPGVGTAHFPEPCCVEGPFFIGVEYTEFPVASMTFDGEALIHCTNWIYVDGGWNDWRTFPGRGAHRNLVLWVNGNTNSPECGGDCVYVPGDCDHNGVPLELGDAVAMIGMYRGSVAPPYECPCPPHGDNFAPTADPNGNCVAFELGDAVTEIGAYRGTAEASGCPDCPGSLRLLPGNEERLPVVPSFKSKMKIGKRSDSE